MIFDELNRIGMYKGMCPELDVLIDFVMRRDLIALPKGKTELKPGEIWISNNHVDLQPEQPVYEMHKDFLDVHIALTEGETIAWLPAEAVVWPESPDETVMAKGPEGVLLPMHTGTFAVFFPNDAHRPSLGQGSCEKLVGKARVEK